MSSFIQTSHPAAGTASTASPDALKATAVSSNATPAGVAEPVSAQVPDEQLAMQVLLDDAAGGGAASTAPSEDAEPASNSNGAPWLLTPSDAPMSAADIADRLAVMNENMATKQVLALDQQLKMNSTQQKQAISRTNELILKNIELAKQAEARRKASGILGWIKKSVTFVAAAVAIAVIGFVAAPVATLIIAVALGAMLNATMCMASDISEACHGPPLPGSMSAALTMGLVVMLQKAGASDHLAKGLGMVLSGSLALLACLATGGAGAVMMDPGFVGQLVGGAAMLGGSGEAMTNTVAGWTTVAATVITVCVLIALTGPMELTDTASMVLKASKTLSAATVVGTGAYQAKLDLEIGRIKADQLEMQADSIRLSALITRLQSQWEAAKNELNRVIAALNDNNGVIADILNGAYDQVSRMLDLMNGKSTV